MKGSGGSRIKSALFRFADVEVRERESSLTKAGRGSARGAQDVSRAADPAPQHGKRSPRKNC